MVGQVRGEVLPNGHRTHAGASTSVGDAERLVQVQVRHVGAELPGPGQADQCVQVGTVQVDLPAELVDEVADLGDLRLEHPVGGRVGDHQGRQGVLEVGGTLLQVVEVHVAVAVALDHDDVHAGHHGAGGVGAVGRGGDQAGGPLPVTVGVVPRTDCQEAGQLALGAGVGLERYPVVSGDLYEHPLQVCDQVVVSGDLVHGCQRVDACELGP